MNALTLILGGLLVALGVCAGAMADRIRYGKRRRSERTTATAEATTAPAMPRQRVAVEHESGAPAFRTDVIAALTGFNFKRQIATLAVDACSASERATLESWTKAALRRAGKGQSS